MHEAEGINFRVGFLKNPFTGKDSRKIKNLVTKQENLDDILLFINHLNIKREDKNKLIKIAKRTPHGSLGNFKKNYNNYLK